MDKDGGVANDNGLTEIANHNHEHRQPPVSDPFDPAKRKGYEVPLPPIQPRF
jgi:hypothetical protein